MCLNTRGPVVARSFLDVGINSHAPKIYTDEVEDERNKRGNKVNFEHLNTVQTCIYGRNPTYTVHMYIFKTE